MPATPAQVPGDAPKWTPAPWSLGTVAVVIDGDYYQAPRDAVVYCDEDENEIQIEGPDATANARLIAAAPELYEALSELMIVADERLHKYDVEGDDCVVETERDLCPGCRENGCIQLKIRTARHALRKARGEP